MTLLELVQLYALETASAVPPSSITSLSGQTREVDRWVRWLSSAWVDVQSMLPLAQKEKQVTLALSSSTQRYSPYSLKDAITAATITRFERHLWPPAAYPRFYLTSAGVAGRKPLQYLEWQDWVARYQGNTAANTGAPQAVTEDPQKYLRFGPIPDAAYTFEHTIHESPQVLAAETDEVDEVLLPAAYQDIIVFQAIIKYGFTAVAPEQLEYASHMLGLRESKLSTAFSPMVTLDDPLA